MIEVYVPSVGHQIQPPAKARTGVLWYNQDVPKELLDFLKLKHFQQSHETCSSESLADSAAEESRSQLTHRAVLGFYTDLYVFPPDTGETPRYEAIVLPKGLNTLLHSGGRPARCPGERRHTRGTARILPTAQEPTQSQEDAPCKDSTFSTQSTVKNY
ncbi:sorting nexin-22 isoform X6 [Ascaphus truei]|uniref:sorting nexin-22 isoform X6 n=1 Tax=Ascaphus truei TaxID=8439 RepID=UPI003F5A8EAA